MTVTPARHRSVGQAARPGAKGDAGPIGPRALGLLAAAAPSLAARTLEAHGTGERYDLSLPLVYFVAGAALTVALSFAAAALAARAAPRAVSSAGLLVPLGPVQPFLFALARLMGLALFLLVIAAGLFGDPHPMKNLAPTFVWII